MNGGNLISDLFSLLQANMAAALVLAVAAIAMVIFRPKNFAKLACIGLGVVICLYMASYLFGLTSSGVGFKEQVSDEKKYETEQNG